MILNQRGDCVRKREGGTERKNKMCVWCVAQPVQLAQGTAA